MIRCLQSKLQHLLQQCEPKQVPDAVCRYLGCLQHHTSSNIMVDNAGRGRGGGERGGEGREGKGGERGEGRKGGGGGGGGRGEGGGRRGNGREMCQHNCPGLGMGLGALVVTPPPPPPPADYKGYIRMACSEGCNICYHPACWRKFKGDSVVGADKDFMGTPCPTPDCEGDIRSVWVYDHIGLKKVKERQWTSGHRPFSDQNGKMTDQVPICLDMNPIGFLLCPSKSYHTWTECPTQNSILISSSASGFLRSITRELNMLTMTCNMMYKNQIHCF